jgi:hypothetical protein
MMPGMRPSREATGAWAALLCAALAVGCAQSTAPAFGPADLGEDAGATPAEGAEGGTSREDASANSMSTGHTDMNTDTDASAPTSTKPTKPQDAGKESGTGTSMSGSTGDGGPCTVNLACTLAAPPSTGDIVQDCVNRINQFRTTCACLKPLARWTAGESCANMDAQYDAMMNTGHAGARANICPWGMGQDECPGYPNNQSVITQCLQQMWSEGPPPAGTSVAQCEADSTCFEAHGHFINMSNTMVTQVACGFYTTSGGAVWAPQNFSP